MALEAIFNEWQSADSYSTRISKIKAGVGSGSKFVWGTTVHDNSTSNANTLTGGGGSTGTNWFFANLSHTTTNKTAYGTVELADLGPRARQSAGPAPPWETTLGIAFSHVHGYDRLGSC